MNKDEAKRCIDLGLQALREKAFDRAVSFFEKSAKLDPSDEAKAYIALTLEKKQEWEKTCASKPEPATSTAPEYTTEQETLCTTIIGTQNYYEVLSIAQDASLEDIKKAYKRLALKLHPDKNRAPSAADAFKRINRAVDCLSNPQTRLVYDRTGSDEALQSGSAAHFENVFTEEAFRKFFGESFFFPEHKMPAQPQQRSKPKTALYIQLLPVIILVGLSVYSIMSSSSAIYSFHSTPEFTVKQYTETLHVEYWLKPAYARELTPADFEDLHSRVEQEYLKKIEPQCQKEGHHVNPLCSHTHHTHLSNR